MPYQSQYETSALYRTVKPLVLRFSGGSKLEKPEAPGRSTQDHNSASLKNKFGLVLETMAVF